MKLLQQVSLTEEEIVHLIEKYVRSKYTGPTDREWEYEVHIYWRAKRAVIDVQCAVPTLTDKV